MATRVSDRAEAILADYRSGMGARVVARRNSVSPKTVRNVLERLGEPTRNPSVAATRYSLDPAPFEADPLSPAAAYFVGLLLTDGCVLTPKTGSRKVKLSLAAEDAAIIGELRDFLRYTGPVRVYPPRRACPLNGSPAVELRTTSSSGIPYELAMSTISCHWLSAGTQRVRLSRGNGIGEPSGQVRP